MSKISFYMAGEVGLIKDLEPHEVDPRGWSDARNARFVDGKVVRSFGDSNVFGTPTEAPYWVMPVQAGALALWVYSSLTKLYATDGASHAEVTRTVGGNYTVDRTHGWHGGTLSNIPIITNGTDVPQMWTSPSLGTDFANLSNWPSGDRCEIIKPFKSFLVAMVITRGGATFGHMVKWSHPAVPGSVPSSWDETDPTLQAGEVEILDELPGSIRDGLGLRDTFIIYKDNSVWGMQFIGGNSIFRFFPIFLQTGVMSHHCAVAINSGAAHFVATGDDFIVHDGQNARSVFNRKIRNFINNTVPETRLDNCFCVAKPETNEVWFFFPEQGGEFPTMAAIFNWKDDTATLRNLPNAIAHADIGPVAATSDPWDSDSATWDSDTTPWDQSLFSAHSFSIIGANPIGSALVNLEDGINYASGYIERSGLPFVGQDRVTGELKADNNSMKLVARIWIKATGTPFNVQLGAQELHGSPIVWETQQLFTPGTDKYLDFVPVNGRFIAVRVDWQGMNGTEIFGYDYDVEVLGEQ